MPSMINMALGAPDLVNGVTKSGANVKKQLKSPVTKYDKILGVGALNKQADWNDKQHIIPAAVLIAALARGRSTGNMLQLPRDVMNIGKRILPDLPNIGLRAMGRSKSPNLRTMSNIGRDVLRNAKKQGESGFKSQLKAGAGFAGGMAGIDYVANRATKKEASLEPALIYKEAGAASAIKNIANKALNKAQFANTYDLKRDVGVLGKLKDVATFKGTRTGMKAKDYIAGSEVLPTMKDTSKVEILRKNMDTLTREQGKISDIERKINKIKDTPLYGKRQPFEVHSNFGADQTLGAAAANRAKGIENLEKTRSSLLGRTKEIESRYVAPEMKELNRAIDNETAKSLALYGGIGTAGYAGKKIYDKRGKQNV